MGEAETEAGLPEEGEAAVAAREGFDLEVASIVPRFCKETKLTDGVLSITNYTHFTAKVR